MLSKIIDVIHIIYMFLPFLLVLVPYKFLINYKLSLKILFLVYLLTPLHWYWMNNKCILSIISNTVSKNIKQSLPYSFTKKYMRPIYQPIMKVLGLVWTNKNDLDTMISIHWALIFITMWYIICFKIN